jgi:hypothetical protein
MYVEPDGGRTLFQEYAERWRSVQADTSAAVDVMCRWPPDLSQL